MSVMTLRTLALASCLLSASACNDGLCTQLGCEVGEWVSVIDEATDSGGLRAGSYAFEIAHGEAVLEWSCVVVDEASASPDCDVNVSALADEGSESIIWADVRHASDGVHVALGLLDSDEGLARVTGPSAFSFRVFRDETLVGDGAFEPTYMGRWINGEGCSPYCASSTAHLTLAIPE